MLRAYRLLDSSMCSSWTGFCRRKKPAGAESAHMDGQEVKAAVQQLDDEDLARSFGARGGRPSGTLRREAFPTVTS